MHRHTDLLDKAWARGSCMVNRITPPMQSSILFARTGCKESVRPGAWRDGDVDRPMQWRNGALTQEMQSSCDDHSQELDCRCKNVVRSTTQGKGWFGKAYEK